MAESQKSTFTLELHKCILRSNLFPEDEFKTITETQATQVQLVK